MDNQEYSDFWNYYPALRGLDVLKPILDILASGQGFVGGSFAAWMASEAALLIKPNDIDIYAVSEGDALDLTQRIADRLGQTRWETHPITYNLAAGEMINLPIQVIKPNPEWKEFPLDILNSFDLSLSRAVYQAAHSGAFILADEGIHHPEKGKVLRLRNPLRSLKRVMKYSARGAQFNDWELLKLFSAWETTPAERRDELRNEACTAAFPEPDYQAENIGYMYDDDDYYEGE